MADIARSLRQASKTGTVRCGHREALKTVQSGAAKLVVVAANTPAEAAERVRSAARSKAVPLLEFQGGSLELGPALGKPFAVAIAAVIDPGESDILSAARERA